MCLCVYVSVYACECRCPSRTEKLAESHGAGVTGSCKQPDISSQTVLSAPELSL